MEPLLNSDKFLDLLGDEAIQSLRCSICLDYFEQPVVLGCGHTFCFKCIQDTALHVLTLYPHLPPWYVNMDCPHCRKPNNAYKTSQNNIPVNYTLFSLVTTLKQIQVPLKMDASTNTDPLPQPPPTEDCHCQRASAENNKQELSDCDYNLEHLNAIQRDMDNIFSCLKLKSNIVDDTQTDIDRIRENMKVKEIDRLMTGHLKKNLNSVGAIKTYPTLSDFLKLNNIRTELSTGNTSKLEFLLPRRLTSTNPSYKSINHTEVYATEIIFQDPAIASCSLQSDHF